MSKGWLVYVLVYVFVALGCVNSGSPREASAKRGRSQIWRESCMRCHGLHRPDYYSDEQWRVTMLHMRNRAYLTAEEQRDILELLEQGN